MRSDRHALAVLGILVGGAILTSIFVGQLRPTAPVVGGPTGVWDKYVVIQDTIAQWLMAVVSILATVGSFWAVWLLNKTLIATEKSVAAALRAAQAAEDAARVSFDSGVLAHQPYIGLPEVSASIFHIVIGERQIPWMNLQLWITNSGSTPALQPGRAIFVLDPGPGHKVISVLYEKTIIRDIHAGEADFLICEESFAIGSDTFRTLKEGGVLHLKGTIFYWSPTDDLQRQTEFVFTLGPLDTDGVYLKVRNQSQGLTHRTSIFRPNHDQVQE